jgi:hypothetical protein
MMTDETPKPVVLVEPPKAPEYPNQFCPVCSARLISQKCKMICPRCGYFMSCSEFE